MNKWSCCSWQGTSRDSPEWQWSASPAALRRAGRWAGLDSFHKILKGQEFTPLFMSWTATLLSFYKQGMHGVRVAGWTQRVLWQSASKGDLFQPEINPRMKHFAASTPLTTAGFTRQKLKPFYSAKPHWNSPNEERLFSLHPAVAKPQVSADPNWSRDEERWWQGTLQHTWDLSRFWQGKKGFDWRGIKAWGSVVQESPPELSQISKHGCSCSIYCKKHDSAAKLSRAKLQNLTSQLNKRNIF